MNLAICSIQRDRAKWLQEWVVFHKIVGFNKFYLFLHNCKDNSVEVVRELMRFYDISCFILDDSIERPQLTSYQYCYDKFGHLHDWISFLDGDEFLFSPSNLTIHEDLNQIAASSNMDAIGVYWSCFGSSGYLSEPVGLITENYRWKSNVNFEPNKHIKSIVKGGIHNNFHVLNNAHYFKTNNGTVDSQLRVLNGGLSNQTPCYEKLIINHYVTQSYEYYLNFKKNSGAADGSKNMVRDENWWNHHDRNDDYGYSLQHIIPFLKLELNSMNL